MIFIGVDVLHAGDKSPEPMYTFQDPTSFSKFGSAVNFKDPANLPKEGASMYSFTAAQVKTLVDLAGTAEALNDAVERAHWKEG
jgi:hypothetical protein